MSDQLERYYQSEYHRRKTLADAMKVIAARLEEKHRQHLLPLGRDPEKHASRFSIALDQFRSDLRRLLEDE